MDIPEGLMPCKIASSLSSLNRDIATTHGLGLQGASSCAPSVSIKRIGLGAIRSDLKSSCMSYACVSADHLSCFPLRIRIKESPEYVTSPFRLMSQTP